jgi:hypothetical protein
MARSRARGCATRPFSGLRLAFILHAVAAQFDGLTFLPSNGSATLRELVLSSNRGAWDADLDATTRLRVVPYTHMRHIGVDPYHPQTDFGAFTGWFASANATYVAMFFDNGAPCAQHRPARQGLAFVTCGAAFSVTSAIESPICFFTMRVSLPEACGVDLRVGAEESSASATPTPPPTPTATRTRSPTASPSRSPTRSRSRSGTRSGTPTPTTTTTVTAGGLSFDALRLSLALAARGGGGGAGARVAGALLAGTPGQALRLDASRALTPLLAARAAPLPVSAVKVVIAAVGGAPAAADGAGNLRRRRAAGGADGEGGEELIAVVLSASVFSLAAAGLRADADALLQNSSRLAAAFAPSLALLRAACGCNLTISAAPPAAGGAAEAGAAAPLGAGAAAAAAIGALLLASCAALLLRRQASCCGARRRGFQLSTREGLSEGLAFGRGALGPAGSGQGQPRAALDVRSPELHAWAQTRGAPLAMGPAPDAGVELPWAPAPLVGARV